MVEEQFDIMGEVAKVRRDLVAFRDICLPALVDPAGPARHIDDLARPLNSWQGAVNRLLDALPDHATGEKPSLADPVDYAEFLFQPVTASSHVVRDGRIFWRIELAVGWDSAARDVLYRPTNGWVPTPDPLEKLRRELPEARRWIMSQPVDGSSLWHLLTVGLVPIADMEPAFAKLALDPETWREVVLADRGIDEETRGRRLVMVDGYFRRVLNNALLHVMGALACNYFEVVLDLLDHPDLYGGSYTSMKPHYPFAVLFQKTRILHNMVQEV
jgi:hypothetical protein